MPREIDCFGTVAHLGVPSDGDFCVDDHGSVSVVPRDVHAVPDVQ